MNNSLKSQSPYQFGVFASGVALGGIIGAGVALLLAPRTGEEIRSMIGEKSNHLLHQMNDKASEARDAARDTAQHQLDNVKHQLEEIRPS